MLMFDDTFAWEGFGGRHRIGAGKCRLRIFDLKADRTGEPAHLKRYIVVAADHPESRMSVKSCVSHIATRVVEGFGIAPRRLLFVEHYPEVRYGTENQNTIPERYERVEFTWHGEKALNARWEPLRPPLRELVAALVRGEPGD
jgi:hypothetical protein